MRTSHDYVPSAGTHATQELTFVQAANFRRLLRHRTAQLQGQELVRPLEAGRLERFTNRIIAVLMRPNMLLSHGLTAPTPLTDAYRHGPIGIGGLSWWAVVAREAKRTMGAISPVERKALHIAVGSALRLSLLEGRTYRGWLGRAVVARESCGWSKGEAVAFARRFLGSPSRWKPVFCKAVTTEHGDAATSRWRKVQAALASGELPFPVFIRLRELRHAYDAYAYPHLPIVMPWPKTASQVNTAAERRPLAA